MTYLIPGSWRINIEKKGYLPEDYHGVLANADSNDFYIEEHLVDDFFDSLRYAIGNYEPADEEFDVTGLEFKMGDDPIAKVTGVEAFDSLIQRLDDRWKSFGQIVDEELLSKAQVDSFADKFAKTVEWMKETASHEDCSEVHAKIYAESFEHLAEPDNKLWADRNLVDQNVIDDIERVELMEASRSLIIDHIGKMLTHGYYSPDVSRAYMDATKKFKAQRQEILDQKAAEEATGIPAFGLTLDLVNEAYRKDTPQTLEQAVQEIIEGLEEPIVTGTFAIDGLSRDAVEIEQSADGHSTIYWKDGSQTDYDENGQKIYYELVDHARQQADEVFATTFKDYVKKMFKPSKWKLGE